MLHPFSTLRVLWDVFFACFSTALSVLYPLYAALSYTADGRAAHTLGLFRHAETVSFIALICVLQIVVGLFEFAVGAAFVIFALMPNILGPEGGKGDLEAPAAAGAL